MTQPSEQLRTECRPATTHRYEQVGLTRKCRRCGKTFGADAEAAAPDPVASPLGEAQGEPMDTTADRDLIEELRDALIWCGGSDDFAPGGKAREGWEKIVLPLLDKTSKP